MNRLLLVDDEANVLNALRRELADDYDIETFTSPVAALQRCGETTFDLVIADYKMPDMNGIEFLKQFGAAQPAAARILLSGEADIAALMRLINETHIYRFLTKPWDKTELLTSVAQALAYRNIVLEHRQLADASPAVPQADARPSRIVLVDSNHYALGVMSRGLADEGWNTHIYDAIREEIMPGTSGRFPALKFTVTGFATAQAALKHAECNHCDLVVVSQMLPDMEGVSLLGRFREMHPDAARILISDAPNKALLSQAINEARVHSVLCLHWNPHELKSDAQRQLWNINKLRIAVIQVLAAQHLILESRCLNEER